MKHQSLKPGCLSILGKRVVGVESSKYGLRLKFDNGTTLENGISDLGEVKVEFSVEEIGPAQKVRSQIERIRESRRQAHLGA